MARPRFPDYDLYKILDVESDASLEDIKKAYRDLAKKYHPDKAEGGNTTENNDRFHRIQEAGEILRDDVLRAEYGEYRANKAKYGEFRDPNKEDYFGPRRKQRSERKDRTDFGRDDTYEPKPNRNSKPYYEDWNESYFDTEQESGEEEFHYHFHFQSSPPPFSAPGSPPPPRPRHHGSRPDFHDQWKPRQPDGPPVQLKIEDYIVAMRIRVELRPLSRQLDAIWADIDSMIHSFMASFTFALPQQQKWQKIFLDVNTTMDIAFGMYDKLHYRLQDVETGRGMPQAAAHRLPEMLAVLQAHVTRMKYATTAARVIFENLNSTYEVQHTLFEDLAIRLKMFAAPVIAPPH
ncbi:DnaJ-domain-containing protein [Hypoxylon trugodes]|uniref:DnaJ-domain-containing protein n=1 Tax=Hypoxylon trugodes TaxID=326681 RepID=UPI00218EC667|nr:DnaJ-domain-containing protein [Hypoxylon trugodes]KAI1389999.1 DnaJ-domain-containing protein [Hypoxylon trugodes]